jgi:hypothetical protein
VGIVFLQEIFLAFVDLSSVALFKGFLDNFQDLGLLLRRR